MKQGGLKNVGPLLRTNLHNILPLGPVSSLNHTALPGHALESFVRF